MKIFVRTALSRGLPMVGLLLLFATTTWAQGTPGSTGPTPTPQATTVPLDGGAGLLLAGAVGYGLRRLRRK